jgi:glutaredoxin-like YruB-family protein
MSDATITIYGAEWCGPCHMTKHYLEGKGLKYTYRNIDEDPAAGQEAVQKSGERAIPVIDIGGTIVIGFDRPRLDAALREHKLA